MSSTRPQYRTLSFPQRITLANWLRDNAGANLTLAKPLIAAKASTALGMTITPNHVSRLYRALGLNTTVRRAALSSLDNPRRRGPWSGDTGAGSANPGAVPRRADVAAVVAQIDALMRDFGITPTPEFAATAARLCPKE